MDGSGTVCQYSPHPLRLEVTVSPTTTAPTTVTDNDVDETPAATGDDEVIAEVLVEEISIDGMCGVY